MHHIEVKVMMTQLMPVNIMYAWVYVYMYTSMHHMEVKAIMMHLYLVSMYAVSCV